MECIEKKTNRILMIVVLTLPLLTNSIILESAFEPPNNDEDMYDQSDIDKGFIIKHKDGTYELVFSKIRAKILNPNDECFKDVPIIEE